MLPATSSPPHLFHPPLYLIFFYQSSSSPAFLTSLITQSLSSSFPFGRGEVLPATSSPPHLFHPPLYLIFFYQSSSSPAFLTSLITHSSHLSIGLPRLLLPSSRNSAILFGSLSSAILSACPAHCSLLLTSLYVSSSVLSSRPPFFSVTD